MPKEKTVMLKRGRTACVDLFFDEQVAIYKALKYTEQSGSKEARNIRLHSPKFKLLIKQFEGMISK